MTWSSFSSDPPPVFIVRLFRLVQIAFAPDRDVHSEPDAHVRVGELVIGIRWCQKVEVGPRLRLRHRVVRPEAGRVVVVLNVAVGALDADVHALTDGAVGHVGIRLFTRWKADVIYLDFDATIFQITVFTLKCPK